MSLTKATYSMISGAPVNVLDFGASPSASASVNRAAIQAAIDAADCIYIPQGIYQIDATLVCYGKKKIVGAGSNSTIIKRLNATAQNIDGNTVYSVFYLTSRYNCLESIGIEGDATVQGVVLTAGTVYEPASNGSLRNVNIDACGQGVVGREMYMYIFDNVVCRYCFSSGFDFSVSLPKTSLTFNSCWAEQCAVPWTFNQVVYSTLNSCGADNSNPNNHAEPYGVYKFIDCWMTLNSCGSEYSWSSSVFWIKASQIVLNQPYWVSQQSTYDAGASFALAPITTATENCAVTVNSTSFGGYTNAVTTGTVGQCVALNYSVGAYGAQTNTMVMLNASLVPAANAFVGAAAATYCKNSWNI